MFGTPRVKPRKHNHSLNNTTANFTKERVIKIRQTLQVRYVLILCTLVILSMSASQFAGILSNYYFTDPTSPTPTCNNPRLARIFAYYNTCQLTKTGPQASCNVFYRCLQQAEHTFESYNDCLPDSGNLYAYVTFHNDTAYNVDLFTDAGCVTPLGYPQLQITFGCKSVFAVDVNGNQCYFSQTIQQANSISAASYLRAFLFDFLPF